jgi:peptide/nickel transport system substrate-binding protein
MNKLFVKCRAALLGAALVLIAGQSPALADKASDTLNWVSRYPIDVIDPYANTSREATIINAQLVWDTLVWRDPQTGEYKPLLATKWEWLDDKTIAFTLRDGVKWHNGKPLTVDDAVYTFNRISSPDAKIGIPNNVRWIAGAEKTGDDTFNLNLKSPFPAAIEYVSSLLPIMPANLYGKDGTEQPTMESAVGTGPYRIVSFTPSSSVTLELTGEYFEGSPKGQPTIGRIVNRTIPETSTQIAELLSGGADWIWNVPPDQAEPLRQNADISIVPAETMRQSFITFNIRDKEGGNPLKDRKIREAVAHAIDRERLIVGMVGEGSTVPKAICSKVQFGCDQTVQQYAYDPELSKKLLAEAGYPDGLKLDLQATRSADWTTAVAGFLNAAGIQTEINFLTYPAAQERLSNNQSELYLLDHGFFSINDTSAALNPFFLGDNFDSVRDEELTATIKAADNTTIPAERKALFSKALNKITDQLYAFPMWTHVNIHAFNSELDFTPYPDENPRLYFAKWK